MKVLPSERAYPIRFALAGKGGRARRGAGVHKLPDSSAILRQFYTSFTAIFSSLFSHHVAYFTHCHKSEVESITER